MADQSVLALSRRLLLVATLALIHGPSVTSAQGNATHTIVAPKNMRPGTTYGVSVTLFQAPSPVTFKVWIQDTARGTRIASGTAMLAVTSPRNPGQSSARSPANAASTVLVNLKIPIVILPSSYELCVQASGGLKFSQNRSIGTGAKTLSIFVQTDKAIYKPGQTVLFRAIVLYPTLRPYTGEVNFTISDPNGNRIAQWLKFKNDTGVIGNELKLTDQTALGEWKIEVTALNNVFTKTFSVEEYVLPKYKVETTLPSYYFVNLKQPSLQEDFTIVVDAKYTFGETVKGRATITIRLSNNWNDNYTLPRPTKTVDLELVQGAAQTTLTADDLAELVPPRADWSWSEVSKNPRERLLYRDVEVSASVLETVTGITLKDNASTPCVRDRYKLQILDITPTYYKPGLKFYGYMKFSQNDDSPPKSADVKDAVTGQYRRITVTAGSQEIQVPLTDTGYMMFELMISRADFNVYLQAQYEDKVANATVWAGRSLQPFNSRDNDSIQIVMAGSNTAIEPNTNVKFNVKTSDSVNVFSYQILSKGTIVQTKSVVELKASTDHSFTLSVTAALAQTLSPSMIVVVWFVNDNGELVADSLKIPVNGVFANEVSLSFNKDKVAPGDSINLTVNARAGSYVGLLAVDMSVLLLKTGNDVTRDMVSSDVGMYANDDTVDNGGSFDVQPMWRWWWPCFVIGEDTSSLLMNVGVITFTDSFIYKTPFSEFPWWSIRGGVPGGPVMGAPGQAGPNDGPNRVPAGPPPNKEPARVRKNFPETWIWDSAIASADNTAVVTADAPDTITSWVASVFTVSGQDGLGVAASTAKLTVFQPFFISLTLPYAIIRGEVFQLKVSIFNYMPTDQQVTVTLQQSNDYKVRQENNDTEPQSVDSVIIVNVASNDATTAIFWVYATTLGQIDLKVKAQSPLAADALSQPLLVKPEGVMKHYSNGMLIQLPGNGSTYSTNMTVSLPPEGVLVPGSEYIDCTLIGDIMGAALKNLDNLLHMPGGCGEQNMVGMAPDVYILQYLSVSGLATTELTNKVTNYIRSGYQQELTYQRSDGSFSAFGNYDPSGSTWLSAFVAKVFYQARDYIPVENEKIARTLRFILQQQSKDGSFAEPGFVHHTPLQGGAGKGVPLTAYVLIALHECKGITVVVPTDINNGIAKATAFLQDQLDSLSNNTYTLSIVTRALTLVGSRRAPDAFEKLMALAINEDGSIHWEKSPNDHTTPNPNIWIPPYMQANAYDVEMTSYALMTLVAKNDVVNSLLVARWLLKQQNSYGGFASTQDTVIALEALAALATITTRANSGAALNVVCSAGSVQSQFKPINEENRLLVQTFQLPKTTTGVQISASGKGNALVQLNVKYNVYDVTNGNGIDLTIDTIKRGENLHVTLCGSWLKDTSSGMVALEFNLLTGYAATNVDTLVNQTNGIIKLIEDNGQKTVLYFDEFTSTPLCFEIILEKNLIVENVQKAAVLVYAYYDTQCSSTLFYEPPDCAACAKCCED